MFKKLYLSTTTTCFIALVMLSLLVAAGAAPAPAVVSEINIKPAANVDERLFLLRLLESMYEMWPDASDPKEFAETAADLRTSAIRLREQCRREKLGTELEGNFNEFVETLDAYTDFLANIGQIRKEAAAQAKRDTASAGVGGLLEGGGTYNEMRNNDYTNAQSIGGALIVGSIQFALDSWIKGQQRDAAAQQAVDAARRKVEDRITASLANAQATARQLTKTRGWEKAEAGFDLDQQRAELVQKLIEQGDVNGLLQVNDEQAQQRPRDPFVQVARSLLRANADSDRSDALLSDAQDCLKAASLVPEGEIFDEYRTLCVYYAGLIATESRSTETQNGVYPKGSTPASQFAVGCFDWLLKHGPTDSTGELRAQKAFCLMADARLGEATRLADSVVNLRKNDVSFSYNYACLMSRTEHTDYAIVWLNDAITKGFKDIRHAKTDPDLENLRIQRADGFAELVKVKWEWSIDPGFIRDDIYCTNKSAFDITNVTLTCHVAKSGVVWTPEVKCPIIEAGKTFKWTGTYVHAISLDPGSTAALSCDQGN
jgi:hypothetical protein